MAKRITTRYASCSPRAARLILLGVSVLCLYGCLVGDTSRFMPPTTGSNVRGHDVDLYRAIADRIRAGGGYYQATGTELRDRGYAARPFFTWRLPLLGSFMGRLPSTDAALYISGSLAGVALLVSVVVMARSDAMSFAMIAGPLLAMGFWPAMLPSAFLFHDTWSGVLIALSIGLHGLGWRRSSLAAGLLALFIRELALPFVVIMLAIAWYERRHREALAWAIGVAAFFIYLAALACTSRVCSRLQTGPTRPGSSSTAGHLPWLPPGSTRPCWPCPPGHRHLRFR
jgi:hypothetical protein